MLPIASDRVADAASCAEADFVETVAARGCIKAIQSAMNRLQSQVVV
jgi:hypothetical protein